MPIDCGKINIKKLSNTRKVNPMQKFIITNGRALVSETKVSKRTQKFVSCKWTTSPQDAQTYGIGDATDIANQFGGKVEPYAKIVRFYR